MSSGQTLVEANGSNTCAGRGHCLDQYHAPTMPADWAPTRSRSCSVVAIRSGVMTWLRNRRSRASRTRLIWPINDGDNHVAGREQCPLRDIGDQSFDQVIAAVALNGPIADGKSGPDVALQAWQQFIGGIEVQVRQFAVTALNPFGTMPLTKVSTALQRFYPANLGHARPEWRCSLTGIVGRA